MTLDHRYNIAYWACILTEQEFIDVARNYCTAKGTGADVINWLYKLGQDTQKLSVPFELFSAYMRGEAHPNDGRRRPYRSRWCRRDCGYYREGTKYRKNTSHQKKELSQKQIWREVSGITRDKSKRYSWSSARKATARKAANGAYRKWCKQMLHCQNYEAFAHSDVDWKEFHDPWDWD